MGKRTSARAGTSGADLTEVWEGTELRWWSEEGKRCTRSDEIDPNWARKRPYYIGPNIVADFLFHKKISLFGNADPVSAGCVARISPNLLIGQSEY